ncbi:MAG: hypothetical protein ACLTNK_00840 [Akkermansia muciniphila]
MTVIDYGDEMERLYYRRPRVPARVKAAGADGEELYRNPGLTDLTCDVNFTDLRNYPATVWETRPFHDLRDLLPCGEHASGCLPDG